MKLWFVSLLGVCALSAAAQEVKKVQKFNPVYSTQEEVNDLLSFVAANIKVELSEDQIRNVNGQMVCKFRVDTTGRIYNVTVGRSLRPWIDMAIVGAMVRMPFYGVAAIDRKGRPYDVERQLVFSFGKPFFQAVDRIGFNGEAVQENIARSIEQQSEAVFKEKRRQTAAWDGFTKENAKLRYDSRDALKGSYPTLPAASDGLKPPPVYTPTISVAGTTEAPARITAPKE